MWFKSVDNSNIIKINDKAQVCPESLGQFCHTLGLSINICTSVYMFIG